MFASPSGPESALTPSETPGGSQRPQPTAIQEPHGGAEASSTTLRPPATTSRKKRNNHRGGKKKRRRQSFALSNDNEDGSGMPESSQSQRDLRLHSTARTGFYRVQGGNLSDASIESQALLDHRDQQSMRARRPSTIQPFYDSSTSFRPSYYKSARSSEHVDRPRASKSENLSEDEEHDENTPLISSSKQRSPGSAMGFGQYRATGRNERRPSSHSSIKSNKKRTIFDKQSATFPGQNEDYNVNQPPSVPGSPKLGTSGGNMNYEDMMVRDDFDPAMGSPQRDLEDSFNNAASDKGSLRRELPRRHTIALQAEEDVCFPTEGMSELAEEDLPQQEGASYRRGARRRRGQWPDLSMLDEWSRFEKEGRSEERRAKVFTEPHLIGGRLRPIHKGWHRAEDDVPYRFTYFNEEFQSTIHCQTLSELVQPGGSFRELFIPDPPELSESSDSEEDDEPGSEPYLHHVSGLNGDSRAPTRQSSLIDPTGTSSTRGGSVAGSETPNGHKSASPNNQAGKPVRYGERPTWWLDVLSPTDAEMKILSKTFGIHPLTAEDIMMQEAREKVELFRNYYFVNYRTFEQDMNSEDFLEPVNMYVVVFREGVISFHFSLTPHPANVRRRIRQLKDYLILSSDWISYAIIDDITDVFAPLIQSIEDEVDDIDSAILKLHSSSGSEKEKGNEKESEAGDGTSGESGGDMLRRVGDCRKKVMGLYRLLGNKADVIKGFAKRCNEHWEIAPRSEIGLYLGDIQDHIVTMTSNLSHYEKILARAHGNYLAQINIRMNERQEQTADVLGKLTVLGTIVLPMNIITGLWGMNVWVPGQQSEGNLTWFFCITAGLLVFGLGCFYIAKISYRIV